MANPEAPFLQAFRDNEAGDYRINEVELDSSKHPIVIEQQLENTEEAVAGENRSKRIKKAAEEVGDLVIEGHEEEAAEQSEEITESVESSIDVTREEPEEAIEAEEGGGEPPLEPPEAPPGGEGGSEEPLEPESGSGAPGPDSKTTEREESHGLPDELVKRAREHDLPLETVKMAVDDGYESPIEALLNIRAHEPLRRDMERMGFKLPIKDEQHPWAEALQEHNLDPGKDPYVAQQEQGNKMRDRVSELEVEIRSHPFRVRQSLKRPGMPILRHIPWIGPKAARYLLARQIYKTEKSKRKQDKESYLAAETRLAELMAIPEDKRTSEQWLELKWIETDLPEMKRLAEMIYNDGFRGRLKRKFYSEKIKSHDAEIVALRGKLSIFEYKDYVSDEVPSMRLNLAQRIAKAEKEAAMLNNRMLEPEDSYVSKAYRAEVKKKREEAYPGATELREKLRTTGSSVT